MSSAKKGGSKSGGLVDKTKAHELNMTVLKRIDPETEQILASAGQVCLYKMSVDDQQWQRKNIEGSMFLIKRKGAPRFKMVVLNKLTTGAMNTLDRPI
ncbi:putative mRNA-decapping enzyme-like protein [Monoraphidium neglectum]|uniref:Putative mRNA-decapping enzyme-like protein n=1 Tax=Monoraphidium neglectum TaxID=145388 RepID=A0A0D2MF11_9CHLO|nr:putative mRNA-decapping enzyme-like protein [Monoraphidium neglectum]KIY93695.1 putative mRNA-decapping enzyme-like protein [Monoraphidium neglectum]|eukprot:XP_013892715.1 putative mRNA-decapping enzyme-like protein [Monoraphidium neglectum]